MRYYLIKGALLFVLLFLTGCEKNVELHRQLSESDANDVIAQLAEKHIEAEKVITKEGVSVTVDGSDMARAVRILDAAGLPKEARSNMGDIFRKEGVISSPLEERARYIYALSQELESTLSQIDGVLVARVHVVLPERIAPGEPVQPASAAVFIKHREDLDPDVIRPRIERLVRTSIPGLSEKEEKMSVVFVPAKAYQEQQQLVYLGPFLLAQDDVSFWQVLLVGGSVFFVLLVAGLALLLNPQWRRAILSRS
jgi:type III secretion protein J